MSRSCAWLRGLILAGVLLVSPTAWATQTVVLVLAGGSQQELASVEQQLRSELLASGFGVTSIQVPRLPDSASFERTAAGLASQAAIAVVRSDSSVWGFVWATTRDGERALVRPIEPVVLSDEAATVFSIRATELLNAALLELGWPRRPPREQLEAPADANDDESRPAPSPEPLPTPEPPSAPAPNPPVASSATHEPAPPPAPRRAAKWAVRAGVSVIGGPGGIPIGPAPLVGLSRRLGRRLSLQSLLTGPVLGRVEDTAGAARIDQQLGVVRVGWRLQPAPWLETTGQLGVGGHRLGVVGRALPPNESRSDQVWSALGLLGVGANAHPTRAFGLLVEADAGLTAPRGKVGFLGKPAAQVGRPLFMGVLAAEYDW